MRKLLLPSLTFLALSLGLAAGIWWWAWGTALDRLAERGRAELSMASDRLTDHLERYRQLAVIMAAHPDLIALLSAESDQFVAAADRLLLRTADRTGAFEVFVLSAQGVKVASSHPELVGANYAATSYFRRAMYGALGTAQLQANEEAGRAFYFASPIKREGRPPIGAVVVKVSLNAIETRWRGDPNVLFFSDSEDVVFLSNRSDLVFAQRNGAGSASGKYAPGVVRPFPDRRISHRGRHEIWAADAASGLPDRALHLAAPLPVVALTAEILLDTGPAQSSALFQAAFGGALSLVFGAGLIILMQRRISLAERLAVEERAIAELEERVADRTEQLSGANLDLMNQIRDRREAEEALKRAQADLVQAGKLSALGQMSAGISHELNQPLMAIRSFAENAETLLQRGDTETVGTNLARIAELSRRMGRIIRNLRAFARREGEVLTDVDLNAVVLAALELTERRLKDSGVTLDWTPSEPPIWVRGGEVRLQQVVLNLISNAIDAMEGQDDMRIEIEVSRDAGERVILSVRDHGPGLADAARIFDPFYTTKEVGQSVGMGLGLSISYGIVQSFGGKIAGRNHPDGGAVFTVELGSVKKEVAA